MKTSLQRYFRLVLSFREPPHNHAMLDNAKLSLIEGIWHFRFECMASPCEFLIEGCEQTEALKLCQSMALEAKRIEKKYSRYNKSSTLSKINAQAGQKTPIDDETFGLCELGETLFQLSGGRFDLTSGVLRQLWSFSGKKTKALPSKEHINAIMRYIGWDKVKLEPNAITLAPGMELDIGALGKEYAADRCALIASEMDITPHVLINLGGDIIATNKRMDGKLWQVGVQGDANEIRQTLPLGKGAIATSGDEYRHIIINGKSYHHILNALTGFPCRQLFKSITVAAPSATEAGMLSTLAFLFEEKGHEFLTEQGRPFWVYPRC